MATGTATVMAAEPVAMMTGRRGESAADGARAAATVTVVVVVVTRIAIATVGMTPAMLTVTTPRSTSPGMIRPGRSSAISARRMPRVVAVAVEAAVAVAVVGVEVAVTAAEVAAGVDSRRKPSPAFRSG